MSQSTQLTLYSGKRKRSDSASTSLAMSAGRAAYLSKSKLNMKNEQKRISAHSYATKKPKRIPTRMPFSNITAFYSQMLRVRIKSYGNNSFSFGPDPNVKTQPICVNESWTNMDGNCKTLVARGGLRGWAEFLAMPLYDRRTDPCAMDVNRLHSKAFSQLPHIGPSNTQNPDFAGISLEAFLNSSWEGMDAYLKNMYNDVTSPNWTGSSGWRQMMYTQFAYYGGEQKHEFTNFCTVPITIELTEFTPRRPMFQMGLSPNLSATGTTNETGVVMTPIAQYIAVDNLYRKPTNNQLGSTNLQARAFADALPYQHTFSASDAGRWTSNHYTWSKTKRVTLDPGDKFTYTMHIPKFFINLGKLMYNAILQRGTKTGGNLLPFNGSNQMYNYEQIPDSYPGFTRTLCVQWWGAEKLVPGAGTTTDGTITIQNNPIIGTSDCTLGHTMTEYHSCRHIPVFRPKCYINNDRTMVTTRDDITRIENLGISINPEDNQYDNHDDILNDASYMTTEMNNMVNWETGVVNPISSIAHNYYESQDNSNNNNRQVYVDSSQNTTLA